MCDDFFIFISLPRFLPIPHIQHVLFLLFFFFFWWEITWKNLKPCKNVEVKAIKEDCDKLLYILQQTFPKNAIFFVCKTFGVKRRFFFIFKKFKTFTFSFFWVNIYLFSFIVQIGMFLMFINGTENWVNEASYIKCDTLRRK